MKFDIEYIESLAKIVSENDLSEIALEDGERAIVVRKEKEVVTTQVQSFVPAAASAPVAQAAPSAAVEAPKAEVKAAVPINRKAVTSPMVGTFYGAPSPGAAPFVEVGKTISTGQVVCIIEAMKLMNEIESEVSGKIVEVCVSDGQPVEYGQTLMYVEP